MRAHSDFRSDASKKAQRTRSLRSEDDSFVSDDADESLGNRPKKQWRGSALNERKQKKMEIYSFGQQKAENEPVLNCG